MTEILKLTNTLAKLDRALNEGENSFYRASLCWAATLLRTGELEARAREILTERQLDEISKLDGDREA